MGKAVIIMGAVIVLLLVIISMQIPRILAAEAMTEDAKDLGLSVHRLLRSLDIRCVAGPGDLEEMIACIEPALTKNSFSLDSFDPFDERRNETGLFVIRNDGAKTYNGSAFVLSMNGERIDSGCHISSEILTDYTCRFELTEPCIEGDVYEISYLGEEESRLVTKTC